MLPQQDVEKISFAVSGQTLQSAELTVADPAWPITNTDSVLCTLEARTILQSLWKTIVTLLWQF